MAETTEISWADSTFNPWIGCTKVGPGCDHCYAKADFDDRKHRVVWGAGQARSRTGPENWKKPLQWDALRFFQCTRCGWRGALPGVKRNPKRLAFYSHADCGGDLVDARRRVFCASLADVFDNEVDPVWRRDLFALIEKTPNLDWLLLTKRIGNAARMIAEAQGDQPPVSKWAAWPLPNVWIGATVVNQEEADRDIPKLLDTPAPVRFLSMEPLLGAVDLTPHLWGRPKPCWDCPKDEDCECGYLRRGFFTTDGKIDWVIVGGESGHGARPMHPTWARNLRDQCAAAGVPFLFKQWGEWLPVENDGGELYPDGHGGDEIQGRFKAVLLEGQDLARVGKKSAGRLLDGVEHNGFPGVAHA
jgi:protein gp37